MGGVLVQLLLVDHPERLRSATLFCTAALGSGLAAGGDEPDVELPDPDPRLLAMWAEMGEPRDPDAELAWRVEHWRLLNGDDLPFDPAVWRRLEQRVIDHAGRFESPSAHALADQSGLDRDCSRRDRAHARHRRPGRPVNPPPHAAHLAATIGGSRLVTIPGMGHALTSGDPRRARRRDPRAHDHGGRQPVRQGSRRLPICGRLAADSATAAARS